MKKGDVGMAKHFYKKYRNKGWAFDYPVSEYWNKFLFCQDACQCLMLHHYITASQNCTILRWIQAFDNNRPVASLTEGPFYTAIVVLFQLHGCLVSHMLVLATPSSTVNNTKYLDPYHRNIISFSCLFLRQWCRDVASGADRNLDITHPLF